MTTGRPSLRRALVTIALLGSVVGSLGAPLITAVAVDFRVSSSAAQWTLTIALFAGAIAGPVMGRLGSGPHRRVAIVATLTVVALGGALTTLPLSFSALLVGRGLQGLGLGVVPLLMGVARDSVDSERSAATVSLLSVASTVGIGVGYPLTGLLEQVAGLRTAYGLGLVLSVLALLLAWRLLPTDPPRPAVRVDVPGAMLLGSGTLAVLLAIAEPAVWHRGWVGVVVLGAAALLLGAWAVVELRVTHPLVDLRLLSQPAVLRADLAMLVAGVGMYLLFSLLTRFVQTPAGAHYGFGLPGVLAGAALIPFSVLGFVAGRLAPASTARFSERQVYAAAAGSVALAAVLFVAAPGSLLVVLVAMAVLGFGVGGVSAVMPRLVLVGVPSSETASMLSINQLVRSVGFSVGSAVAGALLAASTSAGDLLPAEHGYRTAGLWVLPLLALSVAVLPRPKRRPH